MPWCSAPFCSNSLKKGYAMNVFPRDPERRAVWGQNVGRENWESMNYSLCEVHFSPDMWEERRVGRKRKLKPNAVPTIFGFFLTKKVTKNKKEATPVKEVSSEGKRADNIVRRNESESNQPIEVSDEECQITNDSQPTSSRVSSTDDSDKRKIAELEGTIGKQNLCLIQLRKQIRALRNTMQNKITIQNDKYMNLLYAVESFLYLDQIQALFIRSRRRREAIWSWDTVNRALRLKSACKTSGYEELIRQGMPLPSLQILRRFREGKITFD